jgi:hypothetical protein
MAALCDWYDCDRKWSYETISRKREEINGVWVNLIAGTTPDLIRSSLPIESIGGGLTSRIIFIYEEKHGKLVTIPTETEEERELFMALVHDLEKISLLSGKFTWTNGFIELWDSWCRESSLNPPFADPRFDGYNGRRRVHLMKLAMIHSVSRNRNTMFLDEYNLKEAITTLEEAEIKMGLVFKGVGKSDIADIIFRANTFFQLSKTNVVSIRDFMRHFESDLDKISLDRVLSTLEISGIIKLVHKPGHPDDILILNKVPVN